MRNLVADELRRLRRENARINRRLSMMDLNGKVKAGSQDMEKRTVRLVLGQTAEGKEILSAPVRWEASGAGRLKVHAAPADGEQMKLHSASGTVGTSSLARWSTYDKDNQPPSKSADEAVLQFGESKIVLAKNRIRLSVGDKSGLEVTGEEVQMLGKLRAKDGKKPATWKGSTDSRGDENIEGNDNILV